ncbi:sensor domain-containing diguanylate cyclase [Shewanella sp. CG12_big_fil_rev_8_21_14_0_65_47_15]|uniref:sensor domain-containing diguanylate cyclase n=1 Tax=Shewanella sp. CG12_big_fil_rev_8_21_14_0_65_47_15 TaxID=1975537 RepID=UPI000CC016A2|nr:sensor domain-containing diguanylate cyclase [Shewanella sp. CG12_big_fil_rev_8_21_14_0_65_47_15]PIW62229.1 MAG: diguanylate cyclase [Shewanella sp. CG12_big_fil_rev_8_21_14_0_65_47_15]
MTSDTAAEQIKQLQAEIAQLKRENANLTALNRRAEEKLFAALDGNGLCLWEQHIPSGNLTIFNMRWGELLGFSREELAAHIDSWKSKLHPEDKEWVIKAFEDHVSGKADYYQVVHRMLHKDGSITWVSDRGRIVERLADGTPLRMMGSHIDITQEKRYEMDLARLAHSDPLTNLMNRQAIAKAFDDSLRSGIHGALLFIDLDGFKALNDHYGHKFGDSLLMHVAHTLVSHSGEQAKIARLGGDEFVILLLSSETESLAMLAQSLLDVYRQKFLLEGCEVEIGLSIGIDIFGDDDSFAESCDRADAAMYLVKHQGKHGYCFYQPPK